MRNSDKKNYLVVFSQDENGRDLEAFSAIMYAHSRKLKNLLYFLYLVKSE
jgi:hypothetical protein